MSSGRSANQELSDEGSDNAFSTTLRSSISNSGLSLDRIQARLHARGVSVSVTALSYWQSGKRQPERQSSISAVRVLEEILELPSGALLGLLPPPRPRGSSSRRRNRTAGATLNFPREALQTLLERVGAPNALEQHNHLKLVGLHDRCDIAADGGQRSMTARAVFQAGADGQDRWLLVYEQGGAEGGIPELRPLRNCRTGRVEIDHDYGLIVAELLFDRAINRGETHLIEYSLTNSGPPYPECANTYYREFRRPVREYLLEIHFDNGSVPRRCWQYSRIGPDELTDQRDLTIDNAHGVHAVALDFGPGVFGIGWG